MGVPSPTNWGGVPRKVPTRDWGRVVTDIFRAQDPWHGDPDWLSYALGFSSSQQCVSLKQRRVVREKLSSLSPRRPCFRALERLDVCWFGEWVLWYTFQTVLPPFLEIHLNPFLQLHRFDFQSGTKGKLTAGERECECEDFLPVQMPTPIYCSLFTRFPISSWRCSPSGSVMHTRFDNLSSAHNSNQ